MSNKKNRVLAYTLAKEISHEQLTEVSGGGIMSQQQTLRASGQTGSMDAYMDWVVDFDW